jgi:outer membrane protein assembly factor BamE (lipoprotein component of BamABCDE complex)
MQRRTIRSAGLRFAALAITAALALGLLAACETPPEAMTPAAQTPEQRAVDPGWEVREVDTSIDVELPEPFVKLVDLARLRVGMTKAEVLAIFPNPFEIELHRGDEFWQYGFAELIFRDGLLRDWFNL